MFEFEQLNRDIAALPTTAQHLIVELVAFLKQPHCQLEGSVPQPLNLEDQAFVGMWSDRPESQDSAAWVRELRQRHWHSQ